MFNKPGTMPFRRAAIQRLAYRRAWDRATIAGILAERGGLSTKSAATLAEHWARTMRQQRDRECVA